MSDDTFKPILDLLAAQEADLVAAQEQAAVVLQVTTERLTQVRQARAALTGVQAEEPAETDTKLAPTIRGIFKRSGSRSFSAMDMRDAVVAEGYEPSKHSNFLAAIHGVLKRMAEGPNPELRTKTRQDKTTAYVWSAATLPAKPTFYGGGTLASLSAIAPDSATLENLRRNAEDLLRRAQPTQTQLATLAELSRGMPKIPLPEGMTLADFARGSKKEEKK